MWRWYQLVLQARKRSHQGRNHRRARGDLEADSIKDNRRRNLGEFFGCGAGRQGAEKIMKSGKRDRVEGALYKVEGRILEAIGSLISSRGKQVKGRLGRAKGTVKEGEGRLKGLFKK
jgi:uncharacterized protein YjbJ (UPF0337 family)